MSAQEVDEYLSILVGDEGYDTIIPEDVSLDYLLKNLLGFEINNE